MSALRRGIVALVAVVIAPIAARAADIPVIRVFPPAMRGGAGVGRRLRRCAARRAGGPAAALLRRRAGRRRAADAAQGDAVDRTVRRGHASRSGVTVDVTDPPRTDHAAGVARRSAARGAAARARAGGRGADSLGRRARRNRKRRPPPAPDQPPGARRHAARVTGNVAGEIRRHFSRDTTLWGLRARRRRCRRRRWQVDARRGRRDQPQRGQPGRSEHPGRERDAVRRPALRPRARDRQRRSGRHARLGAHRGTIGHARRRRGRGLGPGRARSAFAPRPKAPPRASSACSATSKAGITVRRLDADVNGQPAAGVSGPYLIIALGARRGPS